MEGIIESNKLKIVKVKIGAWSSISREIISREEKYSCYKNIKLLPKTICI